MNVLDLIGTPYDMHNKNGLSCWGLVAVHYASKDIVLPDYRIDSLDVREITRAFTEAFNEGKHGFIRTNKPKDFDVVVFKSRLQMHCGLLYRNKILHSSPGKGVVYQEMDMVMGFTSREYWTYDQNKTV